MRRVLSTAVLALAVAAGVAYATTTIAPRAAIRAATQTIRGCMNKHTRALTVARPGHSCPKETVTYQWNVTGPRGAQGSAGAAGPKGDTGVPGAPGTQGTVGPPGAKGDAGSDATVSIAVAPGSGLTATPSPLTNTGTLGTDFSTLQKRVSGACTGAQAIQAVNQDGTVSCGTFLTPSSYLHPTAFLGKGTSNFALVDAHGVQVLASCSAGGVAELDIRADGADDVFFASNSTTQANQAGRLAPGSRTAMVVAGTSPAIDNGTFNATPAFALESNTVDGLFMAWSATAIPTFPACFFELSALVS